MPTSSGENVQAKATALATRSFSAAAAGVTRAASSSGAAAIKVLRDRLIIFLPGPFQARSSFPKSLQNSCVAAMRLPVHSCRSCNERGGGKWLCNGVAHHKPRVTIAVYDTGPRVALTANSLLVRIV